MSMEELAGRVREVIERNRYLNLATQSDNGVWIAALAYCVYPDYSFVYYSSRSARHTQHITANPIVACSIYDSSLSSDVVDGIQFSAQVELVPARQLVSVVPKYFKQLFPVSEIRRKWIRAVKDFSGLAAQRFYRIRPLDMFTIDLHSIKEDKRVEVDLDVLKSDELHK